MSRATVQLACTSRAASVLPSRPATQLIVPALTRNGSDYHCLCLPHGWQWSTYASVPTSSTGTKKRAPAWTGVARPSITRKKEVLFTGPECNSLRRLTARFWQDEFVHVAIELVAMGGAVGGEVKGNFRVGAVE